MLARQELADGRHRARAEDADFRRGARGGQVVIIGVRRAAGADRDEVPPPEEYRYCEDAPNRAAVGPTSMGDDAEMSRPRPGEGHHSAYPRGPPTSVADLTFPDPFLRFLAPASTERKPVIAHQD